MTPTDEKQLSDAIASARRPLSIRGGGTRNFGMPAQGEILSLAAMSGIKLYEPGALTIVAGAGTPLAEIQTALDAERQRLAFEPMDHRSLLGTTGTPTIGGVVAANISGPRRVSVGACRDFLLGVRYADGNGNIVKNGGRVMKNVTGYDLVKLMAGSFGTLGVLSEVALKVLPKTEMNAVLKLAGLSDDRAVVAMLRALASPFEVTGAAHAAVGPTGDPLTCIRIEGFESSVRYRAGRLTELLGDVANVTVDYDQNSTNECWKLISDVEGFQSLDGDVWRLSVTASQAPYIARDLRADRIMYDWGGGLIWALVPQGTDLRKRLGDYPGHATLVRADANTRSRLSVFHPETGTIATITAGLRAKFDPRGIFNVGLMG